MFDSMRNALKDFHAKLGHPEDYAAEEELAAEEMVAQEQAQGEVQAQFGPISGAGVEIGPVSVEPSVEIGKPTFVSGKEDLQRRNELKRMDPPVEESEIQPLELALGGMASLGKKALAKFAEKAAAKAAGKYTFTKELGKIVPDLVDPTKIGNRPMRSAAEMAARGAQQEIDAVTPGNVISDRLRMLRSKPAGPRPPTNASDFVEQVATGSKNKTAELGVEATKAAQQRTSFLDEFVAELSDFLKDK